MAWTTEDLTNIEVAIAQGTRRVRLGQREKEFHSIEQLEKARDMIKAEINATATDNRRPSAFYSRTSKGL